MHMVKSMCICCLCVLCGRMLWENMAKNDKSVCVVGGSSHGREEIAF